MTIHDVARHAGVSVATVSRVLNGTTVRPEHAEAVRLAVEELSYLPNRSARSLRRQLSEVIGLIVPDIENPFFTTLARGVEDLTWQAGHSLVLCNTDDDPAKERSYLKIAASENMAGVIVAPASESLDVVPLLGRGMSVVVVDRAVDAEAVDQVVVDNEAAARTATQALIDQGYERIACVTGPRATVTARLRAQSWRETMEAAGLPCSDDLLKFANFRVDGGQEAMRSLCAARPDAVLATNNLVGVGVLKELEAAGDGIGLAVLGALPFATTVRRDVLVVPLGAKEMGETAARFLLERIARTVTGPGRLHVQPVPAVRRLGDLV
ncbi:LacI family DNA-binding transcriptional regulator [Ornithinimicrobium cavernae]|uniref:LacI family DNA-binding transcriptional regulator n=1 Tax=Ornithinimicrobium cavernae TaxID=2666047 RepID=UPI00192A5068|nr:LacI family DNA-binding transcriptional regulator [Ornithinimicrobium cavernae]